MIRNVWFAPDVCGVLSDRDATLSVCMNTVTQYMIEETHRHGTLEDDVKVFDDAVCAITCEAIAHVNPHLRGLVGVIVNRKGATDYGDVEVRFTNSYLALIANNPGALLTH